MQRDSFIVGRNQTISLRASEPAPLLCHARGYISHVEDHSYPSHRFEILMVMRSFAR